MIKKLTLLALGLMSLQPLKAQQITQVQAYFKPDGTRYVSLLSDNSLWWFAQNKGWETLPRTGLPEQKITLIDAYIKPGLGTWSTRVVCVMEDNSIWWYANDETWEQLSREGLPADKKVKDIKAYVKTSGGLGIPDSRIAIVLEDNSIWWTEGKKWKEVSQKGMPEQVNIRVLRSYQKAAMMGNSETRYVTLMDNNSLWWFADGGKWKEIELEGLPAGKAITQLDIYIKTTAGMTAMQEGRLVVATEDQTLWWMAANSKGWNKISMAGLPQGYELKSMKAYQKYAGLSPETRILVLLGDGSLWWYADGKRWTPVPMKGLPQH